MPHRKQTNEVRMQDVYRGKETKPTQLFYCHFSKNVNSFFLYRKKSVGKSKGCSSSCKFFLQSIALKILPGQEF